MAAIRHLARAPITEAIADFRVTLPGGFKAESFASLRDALHDKYPVVNERRLVEARFGMKEGKTLPPAAEIKGLQGYFFQSEDGRNIGQFRVDGFTYNRLAPYTSWEEIRPEALRLWDLYLGIATPERLDRLALRYINRFKIPSTVDLSRYLEVLPPYFPGAPQYLASSLVKVSSHDPGTGYLANVTEAIESGPENPVVILDIDAYTLSGLGLRSAELTPALARLHQIKNEIFFGSITEETARLYE
jgi:uncharacterized protein (TIGR04255 family)